MTEYEQRVLAVLMPVALCVCILLAALCGRLWHRWQEKEAAARRDRARGVWGGTVRQVLATAGLRGEAPPGGTILDWQSTRGGFRLTVWRSVFNQPGRACRVRIEAHHPWPFPNRAAVLDPVNLQTAEGVDLMLRAAHVLYVDRQPLLNPAAFRNAVIVTR